MRVRRAAAWGLAVATPVVVLLDWSRLAPRPDSGVPAWIWPLGLLAALVPALVGLSIALRQPANPIAWILLVGALLAAPWTALIPSLGWSLQVGRGVWPLLYAWPIAVAFVFPDGRLPSPRWRRVGIGAVVCFVGFMSLAMLDPSRFDSPDRSVPNPMRDLGLSHGLDWIRVPFWLGILASLFAGAFAIWVRLRRSSGVERLQLLWLAWAASLIPVGLLLCALWELAFHGVGDVVFSFLLVMEATVAAAVWIAVVRYRLYAIERLINRTLVYATLTIVLVGGYLGVTVALGVALGDGSAWATAAATLVVALAFRPLRSRVQTTVDRRFDRARYEGLRAVQEFENRVREDRAAPEEIGQVLARALRDPLADLYFWLPSSETYATASGETVATLPDDGRARSEIEREGALRAVLLHDPALVERPELLLGILAAATLSVEIARLRVEVRLQLEEVRASRARIVEAGYEERRRLERDLHDGAQQRLVSLGLQIRRMQRTLPRETGILAPALDKIVHEVGSAIADLRQIAAGVRPARLDDGLAAALRDLARSAPLAVDVDAPIGRVSASAEAAAYFVACEALTNAVKHASASKVTLQAQRENGTLLLRVSDDGVGGAVARRGSGLAGLEDRVAAHGGSIEIASPRGGGTRVEVAIPCES
jgi:signal transduction histidine kinase